MQMQVTNDIGKLQKVIVHRPGEELEYLTPKFLEELLFDEIPWLKRAREEHDGFVKIMRDEGVEVLYITELMADVLNEKSQLKEQFIGEHLDLSHIANMDTREAVYDYLMEKDNSYVIDTLIRGLKKDYVQTIKDSESLADLTKSSFPFYLAPLPSMYFSRDQGIAMANSMLTGSMFNDTRRRETLFIEYILKHHNVFKNIEPIWGSSLPPGVEGGDIIVLSEKTIMIGLSERTTVQAIETVAKEILIEKQLAEEILIVQIPAKRAYMHLDTVLTMVDHDKFLMYPGIKDRTYTYLMTADKKGKVKAKKGNGLKEDLEKSLNRPVKIIFSGEDDPIIAAREQWGDSTNTLAIAPGKVLVYNRNMVTNKQLKKEGIDILEFEGSELVRGRGGPRCMSMPISRENLK
ncbi:arginine deiminase [Alkalicella caledoniensis]|uniref:arginine deiminase n=1 Tax=Alkalicella caledoniensis TaxID=2731377 RepID=A0A7G9W928_ALKCA|nr:arginine deiminase [Alkalicella caledoniensis]QNO15190.1 arginine deiminase [Alkalicella caledoniensis]